MGALKKLALINILLKAVDIVTTHLFVGKFGSEVEANPVVRESINYFGLTPALGLNFAYSVLVIILAYRLKYKVALWGIAIVLSLVCANNLLQMFLFYNRG